MYNSAKLKECLTGLIGLRQGYGLQYERLNPVLTDGPVMFLDDIHPLINIENLTSAYKNARELGYTAWSGTADYLAGDRVLKGNVGYKALVDNTNVDPEADPAVWEVVNVISEQIELSIKASIDKLMQAVFTRKKLNQVVKTMVDDFYLYDGRAEFSNKNANNGRFVGFRISLNKSHSDVTVKVPRISFQIDAASPDLKVYLFNTSNPEAVRVVPVNYDQVGSAKWFDMNLELPYFYDGEYVIGYFEADLPLGAQTIKKETNLVNMAGCSSCQGRDYAMFQKRSKYMTVQPFYVDAANLNGLNLWEQDDEVYVERNNWGMNLSMNVQCDLSDFICSNKNMIVEALAMQSAVDVLKQMQYSSKDNQNLQKLKDQMNYALYGSKENFNSGLIKDTERAIDALNFDLSSLNSVCLPCVELPMVGRRVV